MIQSTNGQIGTPKIDFIGTSLFKKVNVHEQDLDKSLYLGAKISKRPQIGENSSKIRR